MKSDIRLAIVTLYCICSVGLITPFGIYRLYVGDIMIGIADLSIVAVFIGLMLMAWKPGKSRLASDLTACSATLAVTAVVLVLQLSYLWAFSTLVGNFLMARRWVAMLASTVLVISVGLHASSFDSTTERVTFLAVATMVSLFSLIFATRVDSQHGELSYIAARDGLTGAFNRRSMDHDLLELTRHLPADGTPHCLAILDLDNFKALNDQFGHKAGDDVLIKLTAIVRTSTREKDRFYRYGGEEFVLLLPRTSLDGAQVALANLRQALTAELIVAGCQVTASFGLAKYQPMESVADWLRRADQALLEAKQTGKDRIVTAS